MSSRRAIDALHRARGAVGEALGRWDAADLTRIYQCNALVEEAASALRSLESPLAAEGRLAVEEARPILAEIERDATRLGRLVDACLAFQRGLLLRLGSSTGAYGASGAILEERREGARAGVEA